MTFRKKRTFEDRAWWHWGAYPTLYPDSFEYHLERGEFDHLREPLSVAGAGRQSRQATVARKGNPS